MSELVIASYPPRLAQADSLRLEHLADLALAVPRQDPAWMPGDRLIAVAHAPATRPPTARALAGHGYPGMGMEWTTADRNMLADLMMTALMLGRACGLGPDDLAELLRVVPS